VTPERQNQEQGNRGQDALFDEGRLIERLLNDPRFVKKLEEANEDP
jgi:hypothetical protein